MNKESSLQWLEKNINNVCIKTIAKTLIFLMFGIKLYSIVIFLPFSKYVALTPILFFYTYYFYKKNFKMQKILISNIIAIIFTSLILMLITKVNFLYEIYLKFEVELWLVILIIGLISLSLSLYLENKEPTKKLEMERDLFNLFYVNTSKVHEIAMLIDNKVMKSFEEQNEFEDIEKLDYSLGLNKESKKSINFNNLKEKRSKKSIYENFDVKITKSILLGRIYSVIKNKKVKDEKAGGIFLFKDAKLSQINTDHTVMILNVMKDMNMTNMATDNIEINFSKVMNEMLEDFTIDYTFEYEGDTYLIRIPYNSKEHFENNYSHNDLQLGKLSIIGIYRGEINFTNISSISDKFLELISTSQKKQPLNRGGLVSSTSEVENDNTELNLTNNKLKGKHHLIDLIAIIQEINT